MEKLSLDEIKSILELEGEKGSMFDYYVKEYDYYKLADDYVLSVRRKPGIDSTIYYDDEYEAPDVTENYFIHYNVRSNDHYYKFEDIRENKPYIILNFGNSIKRVAPVYSLYYEDYMNNKKYYQDKNLYIRELTDDEIKDYNELMDQYKEAYVERLKKYFKRYNNKISTYGYWANR